MNLAYLPNYTYKDYKLWEGDWELIYGVPYAMAPAPVKKHQYLASLINHQLMESLEDCEECEVLIEEDYLVDDYTVLRPDIAVSCNDDNEEYISKAPEIVIEIVSPSTKHRDENLKFSIYEKEKVKYYIIIYPDELKAKIFKHNKERFIKEGDYENEIYEFKDISCYSKIDFHRVFKRFRK